MKNKNDYYEGNFIGCVLLLVFIAIMVIVGMCINQCLIDNGRDDIDVFGRKIQKGKTVLK